MVDALRIQPCITEDLEVMLDRWGVQVVAAAAVLPR